MMKFPFFAAVLGLILTGGSATPGAARGQEVGAPANATTTEASAVGAPATGLPASSTAARLPANDVATLRRLVRDVATNTDNIRSKGSFGAQLWLTPNGSFSQEWRKPEGPTLSTVQIAQRGQPIYTAVIFYGEAHTAGGLSNVSYDITVLRPDGTVYNRRDALVGYQNLAPANERELQLGRNFINVTVTPDDPAGLYTVNAVVHDNVSKVDLPLKQTFVVE